MTRITEYTIEDFAIKLLEHLGYEYIYAPGIARDGENPKSAGVLHADRRTSYEEIVLTHRMAEAVQESIPPCFLPTVRSH